VKKTIPAVFFQKRLNGIKATAERPERLELFERELRAVVGGAATSGSLRADTYTGSDGWADVSNPDDSGPD